MKNKFIFPFILSIVFLISISFAGVVFAENSKPWSGEKEGRINWGDFQGPVPDSIPEDEAAEIDVVHDVSPWTSTETSREKPPGTFTCTVEITGGLSSTTSMDKDNSWVKPDAKDDDLLNHEKGHLDLAEKFRREKLQPQLDALKGKKYTGTSSGSGSSKEAACAAANAQAQAAVDAVLAEKKKQHDKLQDDYDKETKHGTDEEKQKEWKDKINKNLVSLGFPGFNDSDFITGAPLPGQYGPPYIPAPDSIPDIDDNCPFDPNISQIDSDNNGLGDACQVDSDRDKIPDTIEARFGSNSSDSNSFPEDIGFNAVVCSDGIDNDNNGFIDGGDLECQDSDGDLVSDFFDNCINIANHDQADADSDGSGDICDIDADNDGILNGADNCPLVYNPDQKDSDSDGLGDACDWDLDGDGWHQFCVGEFCALSFDNSPFIYNPDQSGAGTGAPVTPQPVTQPVGLILQDPVPAEPLPPNVEIGTLVKRADMSAVYFIDQDNRRHAFPNQATFLSWYPDFSGVQTISAETLAAIPLGSNVTMRPGTWLIKIQSDLKVYAVEPYGVIRWVKTEQVALDLFGPDWNKKIKDVDPTFFINYQVGPDIDTSVHPNGSVIQYAGSSDRYYIVNGMKQLITPAVFNNDLFQDKFVDTNISGSISYTGAENFLTLPVETLMTLR